jgi:hypothetical protein
MKSHTISLTSPFPNTGLCELPEIAIITANAYAAWVLARHDSNLRCTITPPYVGPASMHSTNLGSKIFEKKSICPEHEKTDCFFLSLSPEQYSKNNDLHSI